MGAGWAFERIYEGLAGPVAGYLRSQGVDDPEGETNEVFLRAFRAFSTFEGDADALRSWIFTIAHHRIVDARRFRARRPETVAAGDASGVGRAGGRPAGSPASASTASAADEALARIDEAYLRHQLEALAPDQRDVLLLRFVGDLSLDEVAAAMGRTVGAVKALQQRALAAVRRNLEEILPEPVSLWPDRALTGV